MKHEITTTVVVDQDLARELVDLGDAELQVRGVEIQREIEDEFGQQDGVEMTRHPAWCAYLAALQWRS